MEFTGKQIAERLKISKQAVLQRAKKEKWQHLEVAGNGGLEKHFRLDRLPADIQTALIKSGLTPDASVKLCPEAALELSKRLLPAECPGFETALAVRPSFTPERAIGLNVIRDDRVMRIARILAEADHVPRGQNTRAWVEAVAARHDTTFQTIYKWKQKYGAGGLAGLKHANPNKGVPTAWDEDALDWWTGLCLKREHRKISRKYLYWNVLIVEANRKGWKIGSERSALDYANKRLTPQLLTLQKGGVRGLDNMMPPVRRDYSDLNPFRIIVGDQHRHDFWVIDDDTGEVCRPEGYYWQDLRTRLWYGGATDRRYDSHLMGLALHVGCRAWGAFECLYMDNGKPEQSKYILSVAADIHRLGMTVERTEDIPSEAANMEDGDDMPLVRVGRRFAIPKNAKAKMIEHSFCTLDQVLRDQFLLPGYVKDLGGDPDENDVDQAELARLAESGKLLLLSEFRLAVYRAMDWMNRERHHRGAAKEWSWKPRPKQIRPMDVMDACRRDGWAPKHLSAEALALVFLARDTRKVKKGQIEFQGDWWEAYEEQMPALMALEGQKVEIRYDPMASCELLVFDRAGNYVCTAEPAAKSSMIDTEKASMLIARKRRRRRVIQDEYRRLTAGIADARQFSQVPQEEKAVALIGQAKKKRAEIEDQRNRPITQDELDAGIAKIEANEAEARKPRRKPLPERPGYWLSDTARYAWLQQYETAGGEFTGDDLEFKARYEAGMNEEDKEYWENKARWSGIQ